MRWWGMGAAVGLCTAAHAATEWFTVTGDPRLPAVDTVQVDPVAVAPAQAAFKTMSVRVNRAQDRRNWDGVPYRSYEARVLFDCRARKAQYMEAAYYLQPLWQGAVHERSDYSLDPKPMLFRDMTPNPTERLIRAACRATA